MPLLSKIVFKYIDITPGSLYQFCLIYPKAGVCPPRCTRDGEGASQYSGSSEIHPGTQSQWLG